MNHTLLWLLVGSGLCLVAGMRMLVALRRAAEMRARREAAAEMALAEARAAAAKAALENQARLDGTDGAARVAAARVIDMEARRRQAAIAKARAEADREPAENEAEPAAAHPASAPSPATAAKAPLLTEFASAPPAAPAVPKVPKTAAQTLVMIVDDSKMVRVKTSRLLAQHEFQVVAAVDGVDAVRQLENGLPDLIITDVDMPNMDGFGLVRHLQATARFAGIPIVMITSAEDRHREESQRAGVGLMMGKPYDEDALVAHIRGFEFCVDAALLPKPTPVAAVA